MAQSAGAPPAALDDPRDPLRLRGERCDPGASGRLVDALSQQIVEDEQIASAAVGELSSAALREPRVVDETAPLGPLEHLVTDRVADPGPGEPHVERRPGVLAPRKGAHGDMLGPEAAPHLGQRTRLHPVELQPDTETGFDDGGDRERPPGDPVELDGHAVAGRT